MLTVPSILEKDCSSLFYQINKLGHYFKRFQIDIADGIFVPNKTLSIEGLASSLNESNKSTMKEYVFDFHLMVKDYEAEIKKVEALKKIVKVNLILIHYSAIDNYSSNISNLSDIPIGISLNPEDEVKDLGSHYNLNNVPFLQIMSVVPGVQGNPFIPDTLNKIEQLRLIGYKGKIFLDGAVNDITIRQINKKQFKPDVICPGSYLTKAVNLEERVKFLVSLI